MLLFYRAVVMLVLWMLNSSNAFLLATMLLPLWLRLLIYLKLSLLARRLGMVRLLFLPLTLLSSKFLSHLLIPFTRVGVTLETWSRIWPLLFKVCGIRHAWRRPTHLECGGIGAHCSPYFHPAFMCLPLWLPASHYRRYWRDVTLFRHPSGMLYTGPVTCHSEAVQTMLVAMVETLLRLEGRDACCHAKYRLLCNFATPKVMHRSGVQEKTLSHVINTQVKGHCNCCLGD